MPHLVQSCDSNCTMPRKSKQRGDKYGPVARRRRGQRAAVPGHEARQSSRVAMTLDDLMVCGSSPTLVPM
jgi:hypothetical protein